MMSGQQAVTNLLERVRDVLGLGLSAVQPPSLANGTAFALKILSEAQRYVNTFTQNQLSFIAYAIVPYQTAYPIDSDPILGTGGVNPPTGSSPITSIAGIRDGDKDLVYCPFNQLIEADFRWFRRSASQSTTWSLFGRDVFIIYPAINRAATLTIVATPFLADLTVSTNLSITDDLIPQMMDLAETLALFKMGEYQLAQAPLQRLDASVKASLAYDRWQRARQRRLG